MTIILARRHIITYIIVTVVLAVTSLFGAGCTGQASQRGASPVTSPMVSPLTSEKGTIPDVQFSIDEPVVAGDLEVTGQGPVGVPLQLVNISSGGKVLSSTTIDKNNYFKFSLAKPLKDGHIIGIRLAAAKNPDTWLELWAQRGDNARAIPRLGDFFDSTIVSSSP